MQLVRSEMTAYQIVPMAERHVPQIAELERRCFSDPWSEASVRSELENPLSRWLAAEMDNRLIGYVGSQTAAGLSDMMNLAVAPEYRRMGVARELVSALAEELRRAGSEALMLEVRASNEPAIALYGSMGFVRVGVRPGYYFHPKEDAVIMRKELIP